MTTNIETSWLSAIEEFSMAQRSAGKPETTVKTRTQHLRNLARTIGSPDPWSVTGDALVSWTGQRKWRNETRRGRRTTFRAFWGWAVGTGRTAVNPALDLPMVKPSKPKPRPAPDAAYAHALMRADTRERVMLRLAAEHGMRRAEVAQAHSNDLFQDLGGWSITAHGKGNRDRDIPLTPGLAAELRSLGYGHFFPGNIDGHLSPEYVGKLIARVMPEHWTMHTLRHRFATKAYAVDRDVFTVQELLGHASPATTQVYVQVPLESLRRTVLAVSG